MATWVIQDDKVSSTVYLIIFLFLFYFLSQLTESKVRERAGASCIFNLKEKSFKNMKDFFFPSRIVITVQKDFAVLYSTSILLEEGQFVPLQIFLKVFKMDLKIF